MRSGNEAVLPSQSATSHKNLPPEPRVPRQVPDGICRPQRRRVPVPEAPLPVAPDTVEGQLREPLLAPDPDPLPASTPPASASS